MITVSTFMTEWSDSYLKILEFWISGVNNDNSINTLDRVKSLIS